MATPKRIELIDIIEYDLKTGGMKPMELLYSPQGEKIRHDINKHKFNEAKTQIKNSNFSDKTKEYLNMQLEFKKLFH